MKISPYFSVYVVNYSSIHLSLLSDGILKRELRPSLKRERCMEE
jgi:hypothetical protein